MIEMLDIFHDIEKRLCKEVSLPTSTCLVSKYNLCLNALGKCVLKYEQTVQKTC